MESRDVLGVVCLGPERGMALMRSLAVHHTASQPETYTLRCERENGSLVVLSTDRRVAAAEYGVVGPRAFCQGVPPDELWPEFFRRNKLKLLRVEVRR